ncbi:hypothetical protein [Geminisphaera colitermitum]|uniref:hypothetical protein n=1 Tax=Geminisphaera colitermitum TaxID=1148786 RepID=UPI000158D51F|nr:hypothetical protein [Geminisphaera colitermitum]
MRLPGIARLLVLLPPMLSGIPGGATPPAATALSVGHTGNPLLAPLYAAADRATTSGGGPDRLSIDLRRFATGGDAGYALIAGEIDAGFVEPAKTLALLRLPGAARLRLAGVVNFPYGATVVLRKGLDKRLDDLGAARVAAADPHCALLHQFKTDAARLGADPSQLRLRFMPFEAMLPALESRAVDAIIVKGAYAVLAVQQGHTILYQNWNVQSGDACCPAIVTQAEYILIVTAAAAPRAAALVDALAATTRLPAADLRRATARHIAYAEAALAELPLASFAPLTAGLREELGLPPEPEENITP